MFACLINEQQRTQKKKKANTNLPLDRQLNSESAF
jgi:hypothetical protein